MSGSMVQVGTNSRAWCYGIGWRVLAIARSMISCWSLERREFPTREPEVGGFLGAGVANENKGCYWMAIGI